MRCPYFARFLTGTHGAPLWFVRTLALCALVLFAIGGCAVESEAEDGSEEDLETSADAITDSRSAVAVPWGSELWSSPAENRPSNAWPGVFDQPAMRSGPGSCGFAATANLTAQLLSRSGSERRPVTPWDVLDRVPYNTIYGIHPRTVASTLDTIFRDRSVVGEMQNTRFSFVHVGWRFGYGRDQAWTLLQETLAAGKPFIALVSYNGDGGWFDFRGNHYVVVTSVTNENVVIAHWGRYENVPRETFLTWWGAHTMFSFSGIVPNRASLLGERRAP